LPEPLEEGWLGFSKKRDHRIRLPAATIHSSRVSSAAR
jgi:hypothetical protein